MAEWWVDAACPGFFPCGSLSRNQISFQGGCLFLSYIYKQHYLVFFSPLPCQFKITWCLYFPQLINHQFFWSMPVNCSWRQLSSELIVTTAKEKQVWENYIWENSEHPRNSHTNSPRSLKNIPSSDLNWSYVWVKRPGTIPAFVICAQTLSECFVSESTQVRIDIEVPSQGFTSPECLCTHCKPHCSNQNQISGLP